MTKFVVLAALLAAFLVVSDVSARTTITTTVVEDDVRNRPRSCEEQIREQDNLNRCLMFLREQSEGGESSLYKKLAMVTGGENPEEKEEHLKACCRQLENVSEDCRCEGLSRVLSRHQEKGQTRPELRRTAENLPSICKLPPKQCQIEIKPDIF